MSISSIPLGLQIIPADQYLAQQSALQGTTLLTQITTAAIAKQVITRLRQQFPAEHPITWVSQLLSTTPQSFPSQLDPTECLDPEFQASLTYPCNLYIPEPLAPTLAAVQELINVVAQLRSPQGGCPWDLAQTPQSLIPYVIEEAYEVVDALRQGETVAIADELGDLLLQVVLQAQIAGEYGQFTLKDVAQAISSKLIRRHPHVFANLEVSGIEEVHQNWEKIKAQERGETPEAKPPLSDKLSRYARTLPPLLAGLKIAQKAGAAGLEWPDLAGVWAKFHEELAEFQEALAGDDVAHQQAELGDLLFTVINLARWCQLDPTAGLQGTYQRLIDRVRKIESVVDKPLEDYSLAELEAFWQQAKAALRQ
jgi:XTP/dITP diphosphohydrolase